MYISSSHSQLCLVCEKKPEVLRCHFMSSTEKERLVKPIGGAKLLSNNIFISLNNSALCVLCSPPSCSCDFIQRKQWIFSCFQLFYPGVVSGWMYSCYPGRSGAPFLLLIERPHTFRCSLRFLHTLHKLGGEGLVAKRWWNRAAFVVIQRVPILVLGQEDTAHDDPTINSSQWRRSEETA